jgi:hypothetical protein
MKSDMEHETLEPTGKFAASIGDFRSAVTHVAERETVQPVSANWLVPAQGRRRNAQMRMALGWACAALLCLASLPLAMHSRHVVAVLPVPQAPVTSVTSTPPTPESDTALLEQVDTNISESVPSSLAPLAELDNWNSANTSDDSSTGAASIKTEKKNVAQ